jgi:hypothetical protein
MKRRELLQWRMVDATGPGFIVPTKGDIEPAEYGIFSEMLNDGKISPTPLSILQCMQNL